MNLNRVVALAIVTDLLTPKRDAIKNNLLFIFDSH